ncbi:hypothetical protein [Sulfitobacter sp. 1A15106]|uniref:hypothetical protein n=1 Tax=Sulfitobacter sp. 1A15106 TaxID=3368590 RepID=UPI003745E9A2
MAFPTAPAVGTQHTAANGRAYEYTADGAWRLVATGGGGATLPPDAAGTLTNDGAGNLTWVASAAALPADSEGYLRNDGAGNVTWEPTSWATAARPASPYVGQEGFNTDLGKSEWWDGAAWATSATPQAPTNPAADFTAAAGGEYWCDTSGGAINATMPAAPAVGDKTAVYRLGANDVVIVGNGNTIAGAATFTLDVDETGIEMTFIAGQWQAVERVVG